MPGEATIIDKHTLAKRELFAAMAMQGLCANENGWHVTESWIALAAVAQADALIAELNKEQGV